MLTAREADASAGSSRRTPVPSPFTVPGGGTTVELARTAVVGNAVTGEHLVECQLSRAERGPMSFGRVFIAVVRAPSEIKML